MKEFRDRVLIPTLVPLAALAIIVVVVLNVSRVLLALEERSGPETVTALAIILASGILFGFTYFSSRGEEKSTASVSLMSVAGIMVILAGFFGAEAIHETEQEEAAKKKAEEVVIKPDLTVEAFDIGFKEKELKIGPGKVGIEYVNTGSIAHTLVVEGVPGKKLSTPSGGSKDIGQYDVQPGTYTYFCDIPGHRQGGMEGKLIVDPSAPPPGSGAAGGGGAAAGGVTVEGGDLFFKPKDLTAKPGAVAITFKNGGLLQHNLVVAEDPSFKKLDVAPGGSATGTLQAKPGTYTLYCDIAGHRPAGMEAKLTVSESGAAAPASTSGGGGGASATPSTTAAAAAAAAAPGAVDVEGGDLFFKPKDFTAAAGAVTINFTNKGVIQHNLVVLEDPSFKKIDLAPGASGSGTLQAKPGTYILYCDVAGHRGAGMEAKLTVT
jgi:plastocyanin